MVDTLRVYDDASTSAQSGTLTASQLSGLNMGIKNSAGVVTSPGVMNYFDMENLEIFLGSGGNTFSVNGTMKRSDGFRTITSLNTGAGNDNVTVNLSAATDGFFALNTEAGDDTVDAHNSTLPLVIFGGEGNDNITGGQGGDIIFGDEGLVDYP